MRATCPDDVLRRLPENGGVVMVTFVPSYVSDTVRRRDGRITQERDRLRELHAGDPERQELELRRFAQGLEPRSRHAVGRRRPHRPRCATSPASTTSESARTSTASPSVPTDLTDVAALPDLLAELLARGYSRDDVAKVAGRNLLRALRGAEEVSARLRRERPASEATLEQLDRESPNGG